MNTYRFAPGEAVNAAILARSGLLLAASGTRVSPYAVFVPTDEHGVARSIMIGPRCTIGAYAVVCGGTVLRESARVEEHALIGAPERGYAVGQIYPGAGGSTVIGAEAVVRSGAVIYAGAEVGDGTVVGHHTLLRSFVTVGPSSQLGHHLTVERASSIGTQVRCSPGSHITSSCVLSDRGVPGRRRTHRQRPGAHLA